MSVDLSQFIPTFLEESFEGLALMESSLLSLEVDDTEAINSIFRAAHSIKGGAGTFGFDKVTEFTHLVETLLDEMRDGRRSIIPADIDLLLESVDCMRLLIESARDQSDYDETKIREISQALSKSLSQGAGLPERPEPGGETCASAPDKQAWQITFIPGHHLVKTGNDPLLLFNALADLGQLEISAQAGELPSLSDMDPQELYFSWQLLLTTAAGEDEIREVFE